MEVNLKKEIKTNKLKFVKFINTFSLFYWHHSAGMDTLFSGFSLLGLVLPQNDHGRSDPVSNWIVSNTASAMTFVRSMEHPSKRFEIFSSRKSISTTLFFSFISDLDRCFLPANFAFWKFFRNFRGISSIHFLSKMAENILKNVSIYSKFKASSN